jgi:hypothetical protein
MNPLVMCTAVALNIFSYPAGATVVGQVPAYREVMLMDGSPMRDWGWVKYEYLGYCPSAAPPPAEEPAS